MKNKHIAILILLGILAITSCEEEYKPTIIEGYILEYGTENPIEGAIIPINQSFTSDGHVGFIAIDTVYTDALGHFYWESTEEETSYVSGWFELGWITKKQYYGLKWTYSPYQTGIDKEEHYNETMYLDPYAYLHLHVEDVPEVEGSYIRFQGTMIPGSEAIVLKNGENYNEIFISKGNNQNFN